MRSIELTFEDATDARIRSDWAALADAGVPSLAGHTGPSNRPHVTLAAGPGLQLSGEVQDILRMLPVRIGFSGALVFPGGPGKYVLARSIMLTQQLLELHRLVHKEAAGALPLTLPDAWTPHVTLARRVPHHLLGKAVDLLDLRLEGMCAHARLWDSGTRTVTPLGNT
ncbi:2'-5' RNA ligase family protein [Pseudarthrobacter sp. NS4]|uniref:2'-5' RNA ligase family protein n=1 Tax=Pseudarthrobacter sp. NS4 TaxID=2973976 RepID=UPI0021622B65|nr:2'-5' RNA ligase family protein [Pseudarthrobacter sp. NS4]